MKNSNWIDLKIGWACNHRCLHCVVADKKKYTGKQNFSLSELKERVDAFCQEVGQITITGGEPLLYPQILELLNYIKGNYPKIFLTIQTNGTQLASEELLLKLKPLVDHITVAIHSHHEETHDLVCQSPGSWERTTQGMKSLVKHGICFSSQTVISKFNSGNLEELCMFLKELGVTGSILTFPHPMGNALANFDTVVPHYSDLLDTLHKILEDHGEWVHLSAFPACCIPRDKPRHILHSLIEYSPKTDQEQAICIELTNQTLYNQGDDQFFNLIKKDFQKFKDCSDCIYNSICLGVWKEYIEYFGPHSDIPPITSWQDVPTDFLNIQQVLQCFAVECANLGFNPERKPEDRARLEPHLLHLNAIHGPGPSMSLFLRELSQGRVCKIPSDFSREINQFLERLVNIVT